jgi:hypothetical protein
MDISARMSAAKYFKSGIRDVADLPFSGGPETTTAKSNEVKFAVFITED